MKLLMNNLDSFVLSSSLNKVNTLKLQTKKSFLLIGASNFPNRLIPLNKLS